MDKLKNFFEKYWRTVIGIVFAVVVIVIMFFLGSIKVTFKEESININGFTTASSEIKYNEIESVKLEKDLQIGSRKVGISSIRLKSGNFKNTEFGTYKLYSYSSVKTYVVIKTSEKYYVYNLSTEELTQKSYETLLTKINT